MSVLAHKPAHMPALPKLRAHLVLWSVAFVVLAAAAVVAGSALLDDESATTADNAVPAQTFTGGADIRYDGGPEEGTRGVAGTIAGIRYDGGPEEGSRGLIGTADAIAGPAGVRYDGGPEEGMLGR